MSVREKKIFQAGKKFYYEKCSPRSGIATQKFLAKNDNGKPTQFDLKVPISPLFCPSTASNQSEWRIRQPSQKMHNLLLFVRITTGLRHDHFGSR